MPRPLEMDSYWYYVYFQKAETVEALLAAGAYPRAADEDGSTPLHQLADSLGAIISVYPPETNRSSGIWPVAPGWGSMARAVGVLLAAGAGVSAAETDGRTARDALAACVGTLLGEPAAAALLAPPTAAAAVAVVAVHPLPVSESESSPLKTAGGNGAGATEVRP